MKESAEPTQGKCWRGKKLEDDHNSSDISVPFYLSETRCQDVIYSCIILFVRLSKIQLFNSILCVVWRGTECLRICVFWKSFDDFIWTNNIPSGVCPTYLIVRNENPIKWKFIAEKYNFEDLWGLLRIILEAKEVISSEASWDYGKGNRLPFCHSLIFVFSDSQ